MTRATLAALCVAAGLTCSLAGCQGKSSTPAERRLAVYTWADYIGKTTIADFEKQSGVQVDYDTYDADATLEAKLLTGDSGYDVVTTSTQLFSRQIKAGAYRKLDRSKLSNWKNLDPTILAILSTADPGNQYGVPYLHAVNGFAYNIPMIRTRMPNAPVDSLELIFNPKIISKFADCGVSFLDSPEDVLQLALVYLHLDPNSTRAEDYKAAEALLMKVRPYVRNFDSVEYLNALANQETCIAMGWSSDYAISMSRAKAAGVTVDLAFTIPREGANAVYDALLIPADAPHVGEAHEFLNFMLRPEVIAAITNDTHYGNSNLAANPLVDPAILNDPSLYPTPEVMKRLYISSESSMATERIRTRTWTRIKTAL